MVITGEDAKVQRNWDSKLIEHDKNTLINTSPGPESTARLLAVMSPHSGDWLSAAPLSAAGLRMSNDTIRIAAALRFGAPSYAPHTCICGSLVESRGIHGLSCTHSAGRAMRHSLINDIVHRALNRAHINANHTYLPPVQIQGQLLAALLLTPTESNTQPLFLTYLFP